MQTLFQAGVWDKVATPCPINEIRVADQDSSLALTFDARVVGQPFGWIVENHLFRRALHERLQALPSVTLLAPAEVKAQAVVGGKIILSLADGQKITAALAVAADGRASPSRQRAGLAVRQWAYPQAAMVCSLHCARSHGHVAVEQFLPGGPLAILPMSGQRVSIVWTVARDTATALTAMSDADFLKQLDQYTHGMLGKIKLVGKRHHYPLGLMHARRYTAPRLALLGEAAHAIHPIAGQGFNLSMRDIKTIAALVVDALALGLDCGDDILLQRYEQSRRIDNTAMTVATDALDRLFSNAIPGIGLLRRMGLAAVEKMPRGKEFFMRSAMGLHATD
jgi:2-octaprenyl-6-methoxyphenol hydroxylase